MCVVLGSRLTSLCWQRVPDTTQLPAWQAGSPGSESPAHPLIPEPAWLGLGEGPLGWLGEGSSSTSPLQLPPTPARSPPPPRALPMPRGATWHWGGEKLRDCKGTPTFSRFGASDPNWDITCSRSHSQEQTLSPSRVPRVLSMHSSSSPCRHLRGPEGQADLMKG